MNKLSVEYLKSIIKDVEYVTHKTKSGQILRWCIITVNNGFAITGKPSACVDPANDDVAIGEKVAYDNTFSNLWELEGYLLREKLVNDAQDKFQNVLDKVSDREPDKRDKL